MTYTAWPCVIPHETIYPRDEEHRYRLYALDEGGNRVVRACAPDAGGIGQAIFQLAEDRFEAGLDPEIVAVYDAIDRKWLTSLWAGSRV